MESRPLAEGRLPSGGCPPVLSGHQSITLRPQQAALHFFSLLLKWGTVFLIGRLASLPADGVHACDVSRGRSDAIVWHSGKGWWEPMMPSPPSSPATPASLLVPFHHPFPLSKCWVRGQAAPCVKHQHADRRLNGSLALGAECKGGVRSTSKPDGRLIFRPPPQTAHTQSTGRTSCWCLGTPRIQPRSLQPWCVGGAGGGVVCEWRMAVRGRCMP